MNVYDFDYTIYDGDSTIDFYFFCLKKKPVIFVYLFKQLYGLVLGKIGLITTKRMKEYFFSFLNSFDNIEEIVELFWNKNDYKIKKWYIEQKNKRDLIISASPDFLINSICNKMMLQVPIATSMNRRTGKIFGENCKGKEKVNRFYKKYPNGVIYKFYSDSYSDLPLKLISKKSYLVKKNNVYLWRDNGKK